MQEKYLAYIKKRLWSLKNTADLFLYLVNKFEIKELKKFPDFESLKTVFLSLQVPPEEIFLKIAISAVYSKKLATIQFLMEECHYHLENMCDAANNTLLHHACACGAVEIVEYLLKKESNPNAKDIYGEAPIHRATWIADEDHLALIPLLKQHKANLNLQNINGLTPLHMTALYKNSAAATMLLKQGANSKIKCGGSDYFQFKKTVEGSKTNNEQPSLLASQEINQTDKVKIEYYRGCLLPKFNKDIFQNVKAWAMKIPGEWSERELETYVNAYMLVQPLDTIDLNKLVEDLSKLVEKNKLNAYSFLVSLLRISEFFAQQGESQIAFELNKQVFSRFSSDSTKIPSELHFYIYNGLGLVYGTAGFLKDSEYFLEKASLASKSETNEIKSNVYFNLGGAQKVLLKTKEALKNFKIAFYLNPRDIDYFNSYFNTLIMYKDYDEALNICRISNFGEYTEVKVRYLDVLTRKLSWSDLLKLLNKEFSSLYAKQFSFWLKAEAYFYLGESDHALEFIKKSLVISEEAFKQDSDFSIANPISQVLYMHTQCGEYETGLQLGEEYAKKYPINFYHSAKAIGNLFLLYAANKRFNDANGLIEKLQKLAIDPAVLCDYYAQLIFELLTDKHRVDYETALLYTQLGLKLNPNFLQFRIYELLIFNLMEDKEKIQDSIKIIGDKFDIHFDAPENNEEEENDVSKEQTELEIELAACDPVKWHAFCQAEKERIFKKNKANLATITQAKEQWKIGPVCFTEGEEGMVAINHPHYGACYATIHPHLKLDAKVWEKAEMVLSNAGTLQTVLSFTTEKTARKRLQAVQALNNNAVTQLKLMGKKCGDIRLWTKKVYRSRDNGPYLLVFDHCGNHEEVKLQAKTPNSMEVVNLYQLVPVMPTQSAVFSPPVQEDISKKASSSTAQALGNF